MGYDEVEAWDASVGSVLGGELGRASQEGCDVGVDMPLWMASGAAWLYVAGVGYVAKHPKCLAL